MFGCAAWNFCASVLIAGSLPIQDAKVMVTGALGSGTGPACVEADPLELPPPALHAANAATATATATPPGVLNLRCTATVELLCSDGSPLMGERSGVSAAKRFGNRFGDADAGSLLAPVRACQAGWHKPAARLTRTGVWCGRINRRGRRPPRCGRPGRAGRRRST